MFLFLNYIHKQLLVWFRFNFYFADVFYSIVNHSVNTDTERHVSVSISAQGEY